MNFLKEKSIYFILFLTFLFFIQGVMQLPVMDRDEARFSTASKTMMETKNFVDIKMQDEVRYKKPIGIYWNEFILTLRRTLLQFTLLLSYSYQYTNCNVDNKLLL